LALLSHSVYDRFFWPGGTGGVGLSGHRGEIGNHKVAGKIGVTTMAALPRNQCCYWRFSASFGNQAENSGQIAMEIEGSPFRAALLRRKDDVVDKRPDQLRRLGAAVWFV